MQSTKESEMQYVDDKMNPGRFQGKPFNITVIQVYAPTSNAEKAKVEWFYEDLQDLLKLTPKKRCPFHYRGLECKSWRRQWQLTPVFLPGNSHGWRSLVGCSPWGREESETTERLHFHFSLSCIGEGNGNPLQCSCLENPRDRRHWWAAISGVSQSWTRLKRLSSSSSRMQK